MPDEATAEKFGDLLTGFGQMLKEWGRTGVEYIFLQIRTFNP